MKRVGKSHYGMVSLSTFYKIIGVYSQIFDSVIRDWLEFPWSLENPIQKYFSHLSLYLHFLQPHPIKLKDCKWVEDYYQQTTWTNHYDWPTKNTK